jgi:glucose/arabinose dehydrogenase
METTRIATGIAVEFFPNCGGRITGIIESHDGFAYLVRDNRDGYLHRHYGHGLHVTQTASGFQVYA